MDFKHKMQEKFKVTPGTPTPYGATLTSKGVNFALYSSENLNLELVIHNPYTKELIASFSMNYSTGLVNHIHIEGLKLPIAYGYKVGNEVYFDPYAKALNTTHKWGVSGKHTYRPLGLVLPSSDFDWENDAPPHHVKENLMIYEMHVRGFTQDTSSQAKNPGTFLGVIEKIPYLKELGVNAVELMPIHEFNEDEYTPIDPRFEGKLKQYWGYSTVSFFAPMNRYGTNSIPGSSIDEFKTLVKALHREGIEVILDVVYNHTAEGSEKGSNLSFKGFAPSTYFLFDKDKALANYSGCGNTVNTNHPVVIDLIVQSLRYWVVEMHVDGFRFDLASIFYRGVDGNATSDSPVLEAISRDPILSKVKLIAEPWDCWGLYHVGTFYPNSIRWGEWNGKYRDTIRKFIKGDSGIKGEFATRISGSEDLYGYDMRLPQNSINFVTSHDGFSLKDVVSYNEKHNWNNGENNKDGNNYNDSWNCGVEGETKDPAILKLRERQMANFHLAMLVSQGIPMLYMGDEYGHTKAGNNNTWCQDNGLNWFQWDQLKEHAHYFNFYKKLIHFRNQEPLLRQKKFLKEEDVTWHGKKPREPRWDQDDHFLAFTLIDKTLNRELYIAFNASKEKAVVEFPPGKWLWVVNTSVGDEECFYRDNEEVKIGKYEMLPYSSLMLQSN